LLSLSCLSFCRLSIVAKSAHLAQIIGNTVQLINTIQFLLGFEFMAAVEVIMRFGVNRPEKSKKKKEKEINYSSEDPASDADSGDSVSGFQFVKKQISLMKTPSIQNEQNEIVKSSEDGEEDKDSNHQTAPIAFKSSIVSDVSLEEGKQDSDW
jgi:hypothetical protein